MPGTIDATKCLVTGSGVTSPIVVSQTNTVTLTARDSSGTNLGVGGDQVYISITNQCTRGSNMQCVPVGGATTVLASPINAPMVDNGDGTYTYSYSVTIPGTITVAIIIITNTGVTGEYFNNPNLSPPSVANITTTQFNYNWGVGNISPNQPDNVSVHFITEITPFVTDSYTFTLRSDAGNIWTFDGTVVNSNLNPIGLNSFTYTKTLNAFQIYPIKVDYADWGGPAECELYWKTNTIANQTIPANNLSFSKDAASSPYQLVVNCPTGYIPGGPSLTLCVENCGDGFKYGSEKCDDGNTNNGDGCSSDCTSIESGWVCSGGTTTSKDTCTFCTSGFYQNDPLNPTTCVTHCGDNKRAGTEKCDDGNTNNGDGCLSDCSTVEAGWVCSGGSPTTKDTCTFCTSGFYQNDPAIPTTCVTHCGDSKRAGSEKCDDGNINDGDGCSSTCTLIESSWVCSGGTSTSKDTCTFCTSGFYQNDAINPTICVTHCGDGKRAGTEKCDDGNTMNGDGCSTDCSSIESGFVCSGGSPTSKDACTFCTSGLYQNDSANPSVCVPHCGDSKVAGDEICDDGNNADGDGCANNCKKIEDNWICVNGSTIHKSDCSDCDSGYEPNSDSSKCVVSELGIETKAQLGVLGAVVSAAIIANTISSILGMSSFQSAFGGLNQLQLILLLPLIGPFIPDKVVQFIAGMVNFIFTKSILNPIEFMQSNTIYIHKNLCESFTYDQSKSYLALIKYNDQSTFNNLINYAYLFILFFIIHFIILFITKLLSLFKATGFCSKIIKKGFECFTLGIYIRELIEIYLYILIACCSELYLFRFNNTQHLASKIISAVVFFFCNVIIVICLCLILNSKDTSPAQYQKRKLCGHCFSGLQIEQSFKFYTLLFFIRREVFCVLILIFEDLDMMLKISMYSVIQFVYFAIICVMRPFEHQKDNLIDFINEVIYLVLCLMLCYWNTSERWNSVIEYIYIYIIIANNLINLLFSIASCFMKRKIVMPKLSYPSQNTENKLVNEKVSFEDASMHSKLSQKQLQPQLILKPPTPITNYMSIAKIQTPIPEDYSNLKIKSKKTVHFYPSKQNKENDESMFNQKSNVFMQTSRADGTVKLEENKEDFERTKTHRFRDIFGNPD